MCAPWKKSWTSVNNPINMLDTRYQIRWFLWPHPSIESLAIQCHASFNPTGWRGIVCAVVLQVIYTLLGHLLSFLSRLEPGWELHQTLGLQLANHNMWLAIQMVTFTDWSHHPLPCIGFAQCLIKSRTRLANLNIKILVHTRARHISIFAGSRHLDSCIHLTTKYSFPSWARAQCPSYIHLPSDFLLLGLSSRGPTFWSCIACPGPSEMPMNL